jgi:hypothetical protein
MYEEPRKSKDSFHARKKLGENKDLWILVGLHGNQRMQCKQKAENSNLTKFGRRT